MGWSIQGYYDGGVQTDEGNGEEIAEVERRNAMVPAGIEGLRIYYGCSSATFFRGQCDGTIEQARITLDEVRMLTVYRWKAGDICKLEDHISHFVFLEASNGVVYFFDVEEQPAYWDAEVESLLPEELRHLRKRYLRPSE